MKLVKFRAWNKDTSQMVFGNASRTERNGMHYEWGFQTGTNGIEIMQFTGLLDKNGREIYEGDIVLYKVGSHKTEGVVTWSTTGAMWVKGNNQALSTYAKTTEIIGNIYEKTGK